MPFILLIIFCPESCRRISLNLAELAIIWAVNKQERLLRSPGVLAPEFSRPPGADERLGVGIRSAAPPPPRGLTLWRVRLFVCLGFDTVSLSTR